MQLGAAEVAEDAAAPMECTAASNRACGSRNKSGFSSRREVMAAAAAVELDDKFRGSAEAGSWLDCAFCCCASFLEDAVGAACLKAL